jgi:hypothetical protein
MSRIRTKLGIVLGCIVLLFAAAQADPGYLTATGTLTANGQYVAVFGLSGQATCSWYASGSGTLVPEVSQDGVTWGSAGGQGPTSSGLSASVNPPSFASAPVAAWRNFRLRMTATGPATVIITCGAGQMNGSLTGSSTPTPTPTPTPGPPETLFGVVAPGSIANATLEIGLRFHTLQSGNVTAIRFYKDAGETGTRNGNLWDTTNGALLATVAFVGETASGWQQQNLVTPFHIINGHSYTVSVGINAAFDYDFGVFVFALYNGLNIVGDTGSYAGGTPGTFPNAENQFGNWYVDLVFVPDA